MLRCILIVNRAGNVLLERFHGVPPEERSQWRGYLIKLGVDNLVGARDEEQFIACFRTVFICYCTVSDLQFYVVGNNEYDELGLSEVLNVIIATSKVICRKGLREANLLDRYGRICLALDEITAQGIVEHIDKDRIRRLARLKPLETY